MNKGVTERNEKRQKIKMRYNKMFYHFIRILKNQKFTRLIKINEKCKSFLFFRVYYAFIPFTFHFLGLSVGEEVNRLN